MVAARPSAKKRAEEVTRILTEVRGGDKDAASKLLPLVYQELRHLARRLMAREPSGQTLQPTALVHEAYLRLLGDQKATWQNRAHFFAAAAIAMRRILVERARRRRAARHGGGQKRVTLNEKVVPFDAPKADLLALDEALERLGSHDDRASRVVHLRYFAGLGIEETAELLGVSSATVTREWTYARAWLRREITGGRKGKKR